MGFCYRCGHQLQLMIPTGDDQLREGCEHCSYIHYINPRVLVSCIVHSDNKLLWIRRGLEPRRGFWAMPAGFMEQGESLQQAAVRELKEETGLSLAADSLQLAVLSSLAFINEVYVVYRCAHPEVELRPPSAEIQEIDFLTEQEAPWENLAYPHTEDYMRNFYQEAATGKFDIWLGEFSRKQQSLKKLHDHGTPP